MIVRTALVLPALLAGLLVASGASAQVKTVPAIAPRSPHQLALAVGFDEKGQLRARACDRDPCSLDGATSIVVPDEMARLATSARLRVVHVGDERHAVVVEIPDVANARTWTALVAAPASSGAALVPFSGYTGLVDGDEGERSGPMVVEANDTVYVGVEHEGQELCGRPAILSPTVLDPRTLTLKPAKLQRLSEAERASAPTLVAKPVDGPRPPLVLHALFATSAAESAPPNALTDGNDDTVWAENRSGVGRGEFAVLDAPSAVPLSAFEIVLPPRSAAAHVAVPSELFVATDHELYRVTFPPGPTPPGKARYEVVLPAAVHTSCVGVVLESSLSTERDARVSVAEVAARPAMRATVPELVAALPGGGPDAEAAAAVLRASGPDAFFAVSAAFPTLDEGGRRVAFEVLDDAPCDIALQAYVAALSGPSDAERLHARSAVDRCAASAPAAFATALPLAPPSAREALADELATLSPGLAVETLTKLFPTARVADRRAYRAVIARVSPSDAARPALAAALADATLPPAATLDVLRALEDDLASFDPVAEGALARVASADVSFRTRFLLLEPAAVLAAHDASAAALIRRSLTADTDAHVRARAAEVLRDARPFAEELLHSLADPEVRVREAAIRALGRSAVDEARQAIAVRLKKDSWPLVRAAAAEALGGLSADKTTDAALADALADESADVRRSALAAIAAGRAVSDAPFVRARLDDDDETPAVRADAAVALGALCDVASVDSLTKRAAALASLTADDNARLIGRGALAALALIHPKDLPVRLSNFTAKGAAPLARKLAEEALATAGRCGPAAPRVQQGP